MMTEKVSVTVPGVGPQVIEVSVRPSEGDDEIALRLAKSFPPGTLLGVSGAKWRVLEHGMVEEVQPPRAAPGGPQPGELWRPRDPRRKQSGFRVRAVTETEVIADDGRTVSLERLKRYEKIG